MNIGRVALASFWVAAATAALAQQAPSQWGLTRVVHDFKPGLTRFDVQQISERGGQLRVVISPQDAACPAGASYMVAWRIDGETARVARGSSVAVHVELRQLSGPKCLYAEPQVAVGYGNWDLAIGNTTNLKATFPLQGTWGFRGPPGTFTLSPQHWGSSHKPSPLVAVVPQETTGQRVFLPITIATSGASAGQTFVAGLLYEAGATPMTTTAYGGPPPASSGGAMEFQTDRPGSDYRSFDLGAPDPNLCQAQCSQEGQCVAWTFVNPGVQGPNARCWLKSAVPNPVQSACCVSGVKAPSSMAGGGFNLTGRWRGNDGGTYFIRHIGDQIFWFGQSGDNGASWTNVMHARIDGTRVAGTWSDVPHGRIQSSGEMEIAVASADRLTATRRTGGFGGSEWTREGAPTQAAAPLPSPSPLGAPDMNALRQLLGVWRVEESGSEFEFRETPRGIEAYYVRTGASSASFGFKVGDLSITNMSLQGDQFRGDLVIGAPISSCPASAKAPTPMALRVDPDLKRMSGRVTMLAVDLSNCRLGGAGDTENRTYVRIAGPSQPAAAPAQQQKPTVEDAVRFLRGLSR